MLDLGTRDSDRDYSACLELIFAQTGAAALVNCQVNSNSCSQSSISFDLGCSGQHCLALRDSVLGPGHRCEAVSSWSQHWAEEQVRGGSHCGNPTFHHGSLSQHLMSKGLFLYLIMQKPLSFISVGGQSNQSRLQDHL